MTSPADMMTFAKLIGVFMTKASVNKVSGELLVPDNLCTAGAILHGGAIMAFADALGAVGAFLVLPEGAVGTTTIESTDGKPVTLVAQAQMALWQR